MKSKTRPIKNDYASFDRALKKSEKQSYLLRLYITGVTPKSLKAIENLKRLCDEHLKGRCHLDVIDVYQQPVLAKGEQIIAVPTLIKYLPKPLRKFVGSLASTDRILLGLDLRPAEPGPGDSDPQI